MNGGGAMIRVADYVFKFLRAHDVKRVFMLSGGGCMYMVDALGSSGLNYICCLHEQAAAVAALADAQYTGNLGVALVTSGPGGTNAVTAVDAAWVESIPVLYLSGQVKTADLSRSNLRSFGVQEAPITEIVRPITKYSVTVMEAESIKYHLEKAVYEAKSGRQGPVWIDIPLDVQSTLVDEDTLKGFEIPEVIYPDLDKDIRQIEGLLKNSKRPVLLAGCGVIAANARHDFILLAEKLNIPVLTTWKAADLIEQDHILFMGRPGIAGQRAANFIQQNADLLITVGARLDFPQTGFDKNDFAREAKKVIVDVELAELEKFDFQNSLKICSDAKYFIQKVMKADLEIAVGNITSRKDWLEQCRTWNLKYSVILDEHKNKKGYASIYSLLHAISDRLNEDDLIIPGSSGMGSDVPYQTIKIKKGQRMFNCPGIGSMGFGVPQALGGCISSGERRTVCVNGDGGFQMNIQELATIKKLNLPIKFFVINNDGYASIRNTQRNYFSGRYVGSNDESGVHLPNITSVAEAYGFKTFVIKTNNDIDSVTEQVLSCDGPALCEVMVDPMDSLSFKASSFLLPDGTAVSAPVEDLFPFLPRKEFYSNMYIKPKNSTGLNLEVILFDFDGTIVDSAEGIISSFQYAFKTCLDIDQPKETIRTAIGKPLVKMIECLDPALSAETVTLIAKTYRNHYKDECLVKTRLYSEIIEVLEFLSKEYDLYVVTSKPRELAEQIAERLDILKYFKKFKGPDLTLTAGDKASYIKELLKEKAIDPNRCLMVGDRSEDVLSASQNGIKTIGVDYGYGSKDELDKALFIAESPEELLKYCL